MTIERLHPILASVPEAALALSGGVDSMTLAHAAHRVMGRAITMFHAVSAAVPEAATARVKAHAAQHGWALQLVDAGEFADEAYLANPVNRCFFCKSNLYGSLARLSSAQLLSGTNTDDLSDFRPGLKAAEALGVRHPFVEAGMSKSEVRALAAAMGFGDLAELSAAPCLASRVETALRIDPDQLRRIDRVESWLAQELGGQTLRCRLRRDGVVIELDASLLATLSAVRQQALAAHVSVVFSGPQPVRFEPYRRGSAFLHEA